jgi:hypothetical protein
MPSSRSHRATLGVEATGRFAILGSTSYTDTQVDCRVYDSQGTANHEQSLIARWVDSSNYLVFTFPAAGRRNRRSSIRSSPAAVTTLASASFTRVNGTQYRLRLVAYATGRPSRRY